MAIRFALLIALAISAFGQTYTASTSAGVFVPENLAGSSVSLNSIAGIASDAAGNVFLSVPFYSVVLRLDATTGILTRAAGNATNGFSGDNGPATNAQLWNPRALAVDSAGNLYIGDTSNNRIRKVTNGVITTVAGNGIVGSTGDHGPATSAELGYPYAIALDAARNLYISDSSGTVRKITNGVIATVPGAEGLFAGIAADAAGNLYLLDGITPRVLKVSNGVATAFAGNGTYGFSGDDGPAGDAQLGGDSDDGGPSGIAVDSDGNVYIADWYNRRIRKVANGVITTVAVGSDGQQLDNPNWIAVDSAGAFYVSDPGASPGLTGDSVRKVANGVVTTLAGNGYWSFSGDNGPAANAQFYQPGGVALDSAGRLYIADTQNNRVRMIANGIITTVAGTGVRGSSGDNGPGTSAQLATPVAVAVDPAGNLYIGDVNNLRVRKLSGGIITTVAGTVGYTPCSVAADSTGTVYIFDCVLSRLFKVSNGTVTSLPASGSTLALDPAGNLYMTNAGAILELSNGKLTTIGGGTGVAFDPAGNRVIVDANLGLVRMLSNGKGATYPLGPPLVLPAYIDNTFSGARLAFGIAADASDNIYVSDGVHILVLQAAGAISPATSGSIEFIHNSASNLFEGLAPGEIVTFKGSGLGPGQLVSASPGSDGLYPTQLAGTSVQFNGIAAALLYTSSTQVAVVVPWEIAAAAVPVTLSYQGQASPTATVPVFPAAPGLFTANATGLGQSAAINQDGSINSASNPAAAGSVISLFATGGGQTLPAGVDGQVAVPPLARQSQPVQVYIGQQVTLSTAQLQYVGPAPGAIAGLMQINVPLPPDLKAGNMVPVQILVGRPATLSQPNVTIAVR